MCNFTCVMLVKSVFKTIVKYDSKGVLIFVNFAKYLQIKLATNVFPMTSKMLTTTNETDLKTNILNFEKSEDEPSFRRNTL